MYILIYTNIRSNWGDKMCLTESRINPHFQFIVHFSPKAHHPAELCIFIRFFKAKRISHVLKVFVSPCTHFGK